MKRILNKLQSRAFMQFTIAALIVVLGGVLSFGVFTSRASAGPGQPFGGMISNVFYCTCSTDGSIAAVSFGDLTKPTPASPPALIYANTTIVYPNGPPLNSGRWMLGTWQPGRVCMYRVGKGCAVYPTAGSMYMVGTSL